MWLYRCWSGNPTHRPAFEEIVPVLKEMVKVRCYQLIHESTNLCIVRSVNVIWKYFFQHLEGGDKPLVRPCPAGSSSGKIFLIFCPILLSDSFIFIIYYSNLWNFHEYKPITVYKHDICIRYQTTYNDATRHFKFHSGRGTNDHAAGTTYTQTDCGRGRFCGS